MKKSLRLSKKKFNRPTQIIRSLVDKSKKSADGPLIILMMILVVFGVVCVFSASYYYSISREGTPYSYLIKQGVYSIIGLVLCYIVSKIDYNIYYKYANVIVGITIFLLLLLFTPLGLTTNGATRWLKLGITIMPGEISKIAVIIWVSKFFAKNPGSAKKFSGLIRVGAFVGVYFVLIAKQPNLSTALTILFIAAAITFMAGLSYKFVSLGVAAMAGGFFLLMSFGSEYQKRRILSFTDPFAQAKGDGFQVVQSLLALGSGGPTGVGIGKSIEKTLYLPEPHTDFILAIIGEELGLIGVGILMCVFLMVVWRCFKISMDAPNNFGRLICGGVGAMIGLQVFFNVGIVTSTLPPTGVALPFVSYGGNSLWIFMILFGIVLNISRQSKTVQGEKQ